MKKKFIYLFILLFLVGCGKTNNVETKTDNISSDINISDTEEIVDEIGVSLKLDSFNYKDGYSTINLLITNNNDYEIYIGTYNVKVYDKNNNLIGELNPKFDSNLRGKVTTNHMFGVEDDYRDAYRIEYEFNDYSKIEDN